MGTALPALFFGSTTARRQTLAAHLLGTGRRAICADSSREQFPDRPAFVHTLSRILPLWHPPPGVAFRGPTERRIPVSSLNDLFPAPVLHCWRGIFFGDGDRAHGLVLR